MQAPRHSFFPVGQEPSQCPPVHVAVPPLGATHGSHETPQLSGLVSFRQRPLQRW
jgi:hypothetical protein